MEFRYANLDDIPQLIQLRKQQLIDEGIAPNIEIDSELHAFFRHELSTGGLVELLAIQNGEIIATGAVCFYQYPPTYTNQSGKIAYVTNMYTAPAFRGRGLASKILGMLKEEIKARNVSVVRLYASDLGRPVYQKSGFEPEQAWMSLRL